MTGQCDVGCDACWTGAMCDKGSACIFTSDSLSIGLYIVSKKRWKNYNYVCDPESLVRFDT